MQTANYLIGSDKISIKLGDECPLSFGEAKVLSNVDNDITFNQNWYEEDYKVIDLLTKEEFQSLKIGLSECVKNIVETELERKVSDLQLENYHLLIHNDLEHFKVVGRTRDLFEGDFYLDIESFKRKLGAILGYELTSIDPDTGEEMHVIIRINRPGSKDFNPPHKDVYEGVDNKGYIPKFVNFWIPIAGVNHNSSLPIVPGSHLIPESEILRTHVGADLGDRKYRVRAIKSWAGSNSLERANLEYGQVLVFSSHLIHGIAVNYESDITMVALEFRLYQKQQ